MNHYTITIEPPESDKAPFWSAHCKEWGFVTENETPEEALSSLFDAIRIAQSATKRKNIASAVTFTIPSFS